MNELKIEQAEASEAPVLAAADFTDELSDEALDRAEGGALLLSRSGC
jgi:hypothetical protein